MSSPGAHTDHGSMDRAARRRVLERGLGRPFQSGNQLDLLRNGCEIFPAMLSAIRAAERSVDLCTFVYWTGEIADAFAEALAERAQAGVRVRVLLDGVGSLKMRDEARQMMSEAGVDVRIFRSPKTLRVWRTDHRTHRKILVCDGIVGFTGGVGIASEWDGDARDPSEWRETHVRLQGPAVDGLAAAFLSNWMETDTDSSADLPEPCEQPRPGSSDVLVLASTAAVAWSDVALLYHLIIAGAQTRLRIATPYFVPDLRSLALMGRAARSGVEVQVLVCGEHNDSRLSQWAGRQHYQALLDAGVQVLHYGRTMLHAKVITVDEQLAVIGSPNFNQRSMQKDDELCLVISDERVCGALDEHFDADLQHAVALDGGRWRERARWHRVLERLAGLFANEV